MRGKRQPPRRRTKVKYPRFSQPKTRLEGKPRSILLTVGGAALLVIGGAIAFGLLRGQGGDGKAFGPMALLPQDTLFAATVSTDSSQWKQLATLGTPQSQKSWQTQLKALETAALAKGLSYEENIAPWVGDRITMAFLPPSETSAADFEQQATVWVLPMRSSGRAKKLFIEQLATPANQAKQRTHQGVDIQEFQLQDQRFAIAMPDNSRLIVTTAGAPINQVIDTLKGKPSVAQSPRFSEAMGEIGGGSPLAQIYVNMPIATAQMAAGSNQPISEASLERIQEIRGLGSTVTLDDDTLNFKTISWLDPKAKHPNVVKNQAGGIAKRLPANTLMMASGGNFQELWQSFAKGTPAKLLVPFNPKSWGDSFNDLTGLDFNTTFVPWLDSKFAGAIVPAKDDSTTEIGLVMLAETSDRAAALQAFKLLDDSVREKREFQISESKTKDASIITWRIPPGLPVISHGWLGDKISFVTLGAPVPVSKRLVDAKSSLQDAAPFQAATKSDLSSHDGQFYVNMSAMLKVMDTNPLFPKLAPDIQQYAQGIETLGITSAISSPWSNRYDIRVKLKKAE